MGTEFPLHLSSSGPVGLQPVLHRDSGTEGMTTCSIIAVLSPGDLEEEAMPTVLGKIPVRKDGIFSALWDAW